MVCAVTFARAEKSQAKVTEVVNNVPNPIQECHLWATASPVQAAALMTSKKKQANTAMNIKKAPGTSLKRRRIKNMVINANHNQHIFTNKLWAISHEGGNYV